MPILELVVENIFLSNSILLSPKNLSLQKQYPQVLSCLFFTIILPADFSEYRLKSARIRFTSNSLDGYLPWELIQSQINTFFFGSTAKMHLELNTKRQGQS